MSEAATVHTIRALLATVVCDEDLVADIADTDGLRESGVSSQELIDLLAVLEEQFACEWDDTTAPETLRSIASLGAYICARTGRPSGGALATAARTSKEVH
ncbi:phosphopantetheine-binding protein [Streptomyces sp. NPDC090499]|uniref:phosphopantetheine-binding protein n=1 Tax=Streptomyces sp. NPDC090499 TaxID=3365965 RepID=UPI0037F8E362